MIEKNEERVLLILCHVFFKNKRIGTFLNSMALSITDTTPQWYKIRGNMKKKMKIGRNEECKYYTICNEVATKILQYCCCREYPDLKFEVREYSCVDCENLSSYGKNKNWYQDQLAIEKEHSDGALISAFIETISVKKSDIGADKADKKKKPIIFTIYDGHDLKIMDDELKEVMRFINGPNDFVGDKIVLRQHFEDGSNEIVLAKRLIKFKESEEVQTQSDQAKGSRYKIVFNNVEFNIAVNKLFEALDLVDEIRDYSMNFKIKLFKRKKDENYSEIIVG